MPALLAKRSAVAPRLYTCTAAEFTASLSPHLYSTLRNPELELASLRRKAHGAAALLGFAWNPAGRYPMSVWAAVQQ
jgi:hypothetical protein